MVAATFDTLKFANRLKAAGVPPAQAEAEAEALAEAMEDKLALIVTMDEKLRRLEAEAKRELEGQSLRSDNALIRLEAKLDKRFSEIDKSFAEVRGDLTLIKWMFGIMIAGLASLIIKSFF